jgi:ankyrin repeat protein
MLSTPIANFFMVHTYLADLPLLMRELCKEQEKPHAQRAEVAIATCLNQLEVVKRLLAGGADIHQSFSCGLSPLHVSAFRSYLPIAEYLLAQGAEANRGDCKGATPLWFAARNGHEEMVRLLLNAGADRSLGYTFGNGLVITPAFTFIAEWMEHWHLLALLDDFGNYQAYKPGGLV